MHTVDIDNVKKILSCCKYYDDIINYEIDYDDEFSFDLIDWYKDLIFSCDGDNKNDILIVKLIDKSMYMYVSDYNYQRGLKKCISVKDIDLNSIYSIRKLLRKILNYTSRYEDEMLFNIKSSKWI